MFSSVTKHLEEKLVEEKRHKFYTEHAAMAAHLTQLIDEPKRRRELIRLIVMINEFRYTMPQVFRIGKWRVK
ncbi:MAG: hypothetical protein HGA76_12400, partial [Candidatus Firestonebacteria bacterium]|nr:hypothetical protein [Candidatus Firestonebacteria bacterium]